MKRERKEQKALGWKIGAGGAEKAPGKVCSSRAVRESPRVLSTGELERGLKKEKQEKKKTPTFPCCQELLDESVPETKGFTNLCSRITPRLSPIQPAGVGLPFSHPAEAAAHIQPSSLGAKTGAGGHCLSSGWAVLVSTASLAGVG